jgi:hypothetical protein
MLTMNPEARRQVVRLLGEPDAVEGCWITRIRVWNGGVRGVDHTSLRIHDDLDGVNRISSG